MSVPEQPSEIDDHKITLTELYQRYNTDPKIGLTDAKVEKIFNHYGPNISSQLKTTAEWMKLCRHLFGGFSFLFWICACLCFIVYGLTTTTYHDNALVNYRVLVLRNGEKREIDTKDLVIGDIIEIKSDDIIPADIRIIESDNFKVNISCLSGESQSQSRSTEFTNESTYEAENLAFYNTIATEGTATGLVIRTGNYTVMDRISKLTSNAPTDDTPLIKEISQSTYRITCVAIILARCSVLCNRADFKQDSENLARSILERECIGVLSEIAVLKYIELSNGNVNKVRQTNPKVCEIQFNSANKYQLSIHEMHINNESVDNSYSYLLVMRGAFEQIIERCSTISIDGADLEMNEYWRAVCERTFSELGNLAVRTMTFCDLRLPAKEYPIEYSFNVDEVNFPTKNLRFLGLVGMTESLKRDIPDMIKKCRLAGIKMIMITDDNAVVAKATARAANIISNDSETIEDIAERLGIPVESVNSSDAKACVIQGKDPHDKSLEDVDELLDNYTEIVFARISPQQKFSIVKACQQQGGIVTMVSKATNDIRALYQASVKVVMGMAGTNACKQAGDILLADDEFASILTGVEQSRQLFANLKKSIVYTMTSNIAKIMSLLICLLTTVPLAWGIIAVLCIDFINITGAISLAYEKAETEIMKRPPRNPKKTRFINER
ncbi:unnamed protein product [Adineta steineri]|uniref:Cation-transporting P-type ATPase N-terminal domain-containing protein n=1 Tax=Adineta steineri TaxID=433720 RepID=A0A816ACX0_9BILA|nr:unnamed protein product [Adineta steineri]CAF1349493.1 unnamed protein product [Adineta steineri]CAF1536241.1 unnamed protein product [Adineta steineri]CAF1596106.1 unnamed protein product [Adineta steineri]